MRFGNMFRRGIHFLGDTLGKALSFAPGIKMGAKALDTLGVGGGRLGGMVDRGFGIAEKAQRSLREFGEMTPGQQAKRLGGLAGKFGGSLLGQGLERVGAERGQARAVGRGLGQLGGNFLSQGLQRLLG
jgi:hypothetical protein